MAAALPHRNNKRKNDEKLRSQTPGSQVVVQVHGNKTSVYDGKLIKSHMQRERAYMWNIYESFSVVQVAMVIYKSGQQITKIGFHPTSLLPSLHIKKNPVETKFGQFFIS